ncbi:MAG: hypothetical protein HC840_04925 [Leptolyngbyaceae cyanobacterium RM2_2_4]|nr:hypothetical protein [Leptolyngbyaceae cyanobacterium RM2_2_4]
MKRAVKTACMVAVKQTLSAVQSQTKATIKSNFEVRNPKFTDAVKTTSFDNPAGYVYITNWWLQGFEKSQTINAVNSQYLAIRTTQAEYLGLPRIGRRFRLKAIIKKYKAKVIRSRNKRLVLIRNDGSWFVAYILQRRVRLRPRMLFYKISKSEHPKLLERIEKWLSLTTR